MENIKEILGKIQGLSIRKREDTILNIGGRGYYENPMSDILAFFLNPDAAHDLGDLVLTSLLELVDRTDLRPELAEAPIREAYGRIDIVLRGGDFVLALENKIFHQPNNPFPKYRNEIAKQFANIKKENRIFCILAPYNPNIDDWTWVNTRDLIARIWQRFGPHFRNLTNSKWSFFLREFLLTVEQELESVMDEATFNQIDPLYQGLVKAANFRDDYVCELKKKIEKLSCEVLLRNNIRAKQHNWGKDLGIALRVYPQDDSKTNATLLIFNVLRPDAARYRVQFYALKQGQYGSFKYMHEESSGVTKLFVYHIDFTLLKEALAKFDEALRYIISDITKD